MRITRRRFWATALVPLSLLITGGMVYAAHPTVRWDIISVDFPPPGTPTTQRPGGVAFAVADTNLKIKLTGSGTFEVKPGNPHADGGGTWETFVGGQSTGSGTYRVTGVASWQFANFQQEPPVIDLIGDINERANGNAVLQIEYSDGSQGILGLGCHGPGAPDGILEGVIATKDFATYWKQQAPLPGVDENRTLFHVSP